MSSMMNALRFDRDCMGDCYSCKVGLVTYIISDILSSSALMCEVFQKHEINGLRFLQSNLNGYLAAGKE